MCGIIGYIGRKPAQNVILEGLRRLEYRGYDSSGVCVINTKGAFELRKKSGRINDLAAVLAKHPAKGDAGIGHTRWATHGPPTDSNAHPHLDQSGKIALVHNGVIENHQLLKERLLAKGHTFTSQTDTEVLAHLVGEHYEKIHANNPAANGSTLTEAVRLALKDLQLVGEVQQGSQAAMPLLDVTLKRFATASPDLDDEDLAAIYELD